MHNDCELQEDICKKRRKKATDILNMLDLNVR